MFYNICQKLFRVYVQCGSSTDQSVYGPVFLSPNHRGDVFSNGKSLLKAGPYQNIFHLCMLNLSLYLSSVKTGPSLTDAALGRLAQGTKVLAEGGYQNIFRQTFDTVPGEQLQNSYACYLSTSAGPVMGVLYVSTKKLAFSSDNPLSYKADNRTEWSYYKVCTNKLIDLHQHPNLIL